MVIVRSIAVALVGVFFVACTNAEPSAPAELETEQESASATKRAAVDETNELAPEPAADEPAEEALPGLPESEPAPSSGKTSTSPLCASGVSCSATALTGGKACRQQEASLEDVYCCPNKTDRIVGGKCVPKLCGSGLTCASSPTSGASACRETASSTSDVFCCPIAGWRIQNGQCIPPLCGSGLVCSSTTLSGASACRQYTTSTSNIYCCPSGKTIVNGKCQ